MVKKTKRKKRPAKKPAKKKLVISASETQKLAPEIKEEVERLLFGPRSLHQKRERLEYDSFHDLEFQRLAMSDQLKKCLFDKCLKKFVIDNWARCVPYQYSNMPLSSRGSVNSIGGRFNIGNDVSETNVTAFNALYIAEDETTAYLEKFGIEKSENLEQALSACFQKKENFSTIHVNGILHNVLDIDGKDSLKSFVDQIGKINHSHHVQSRLRQEDIPFKTLKDVKSLKILLKDPMWRYKVQLYDLPSGSQIFAQIAYRAGVEAILYTSVKDGKRCLAIFPKNLSDSSKIELSGSFPDTVATSILTSENYEETL